MTMKSPDSLPIFRDTHSVFLNDGFRYRVLSLHVEGSFFQYAEDTQLLMSGLKDDVRGLSSRIERSLQSLSFWFSSNTLNPRTDGGPGHLSTDGGGADNRPPGDLENEAS